MILALYHLFSSAIIIKYIRHSEWGELEDDFGVESLSLLPYLYDFYEYLSDRKRWVALYMLVFVIFLLFIGISFGFSFLVETVLSPDPSKPRTILSWVMSYFIGEIFLAAFIAAIKICYHGVVTGKKIIRTKINLRKQGFSEREIRDQLKDPEICLDTLAKDPVEENITPSKESLDKINQIRIKKRMERGVDIVTGKSFEELDKLLKSPNGLNS